jgi:hypothetical protein
MNFHRFNKYCCTLGYLSIDKFSIITWLSNANFLIIVFITILEIVFKFMNFEGLGEFKINFLLDL